MASNNFSDQMYVCMRTPQFSGLGTQGAASLFPFVCVLCCCVYLLLSVAYMCCNGGSFFLARML